MNLLHLALFIAIISSVMQASLDKRGVGRIEELKSSTQNNILVILSVPITFLSNIGVIGITIWSFFIMSWIPTLIIFIISYVAFSLVWGIFIGSILRTEKWDTLIKLGIPIIFLLRLIASISVCYIALSYLEI